MKKLKILGFFISFFLMFTLIGCDLSEEGKVQNEMYDKFKEIYNNQDLFGGSYTDSHTTLTNTSGVTVSNSIETSYNNETKEGYSIIKDSEKEVIEYVEKVNNNYLNYYSHNSIKEEYNDVFNVDENYYKNNLENIKSKKYLEIKNPNKYGTLRRYSVEVSEELLEIFVDEEGTLDVDKYEIVEREGIYTLTVLFKSGENISEIEKYEGKEIEIKGAITFIFDSLKIKDYEITFEEIEYEDDTKQIIKTSVKHIINYSSIYNSTNYILDENKFSDITPGENINFTYIVERDEQIFTDKVITKKETSIKERIEEIENYYTYNGVGYFIEDWYYDSEYANKVLDTDVFNKDNITLYAKVIEKTYSITTNIQGNGNLVVQSNANGAEFIEVQVAPLTGYILDELYYIKEGETEKFNISESFVMPYSNITVYAVFIEYSERYSLTIKQSLGGEIGMANGNYEPGTTINVNPTPLSSYTLKEAYYVKQGTNDKVPFTNSFTMPSFDIDLYIIFEEKARYEIVEGNCENGYLSVLGPRERWQGDTVSIAIHADQGYELDEAYYIKEGETEKHYFEEEFIMVDSKITIYATFKLIPPDPVLYQLTEADVNGGWLTTNGYPYAGNIITVTAHAYNSYILQETYYLIEGSSEKHVFENIFVMPEGNVTVYGVFKEYYTIDTDLDYGAEIEVQETAFEGDLVEVTVRETNPDARRITEVYYKDENREKITIEGRFEMPSYDICIYVVTQIIYEITVDENIVNGTVEVVSGAIDGEIVEVKFIPDEDYKLEDAYYRELNNAEPRMEFTKTENINVVTFEKDLEKVIIYATFVKKIDDAEEFVSVFSDSNNWDGNYILTNNINLNGIVLNPIGNYDTPFTGKFNGDGYKITNVNDVQVYKKGTLGLYGLFGYIESAIIKNVGISSYRYNLETYDVTLYIGTLIADASDSEIENCYTVDGDINVSNSTSMLATSEDIDIYGGGLIGVASENSIITNCYSLGLRDGEGYTINYINIKATKGDVYAGGLIGAIFESEIHNSYSSLDVFATASTGYKRGGQAGGLTGYSSGWIYGSYATNNVTLVDDDDEIYAGGIVGYLSYGRSVDGYRLNTQVIDVEIDSDYTIDKSGEELTKSQILEKIKETWDSNIWNIADTLKPTLKIFNK